MKSSTVAAWVLIIIALAVIFIAGKCSLSCPNAKRENFNVLPAQPTVVSSVANPNSIASPVPVSSGIVYIDAQPVEQTQPIMYVSQPSFGCSGGPALTSGVPLEYAY